MSFMMMILMRQNNNNFNPMMAMNNDVFTNQNTNYNVPLSSTQASQPRQNSNPAFASMPPQHSPESNGNENNYDSDSEEDSTTISIGKKTEQE
jgi:hypothetical protein